MSDVPEREVAEQATTNGETPETAVPAPHPKRYTRKFDYDEAARLRDSGLTYREIGERLGVTWSAVQYAVDPRRRAYVTARNRGVDEGEDPWVQSLYELLARSEAERAWLDEVIRSLKALLNRRPSS